MFGISFTEICVILMVALIVVGPKKLPEVAIQLGKFFGQLRKGTMAVRREFYNSVYAPTKEITDTFDRTTKDLISFKDDILDELNPLCPDTATRKERAALVQAQQPEKTEAEKQQPDTEATNTDKK